MEAERRLLRPRKPLSDRTNTDSNYRLSSQSSSSTASVVEPPEPCPPSSLKNPVSKCKSDARTRSSSNISTNLRNASNPNNLPAPVVSTPSRPLKSSSLPGTIDRDNSDPISVAFRRRHTSVKRNCNNASKPSSLQPSILSTPSQPRKTFANPVAGSLDHDVSEPISIVYSRKHTSDKRKGKEKVVAYPFNSAPMPKISSNREKNDEVKGVDLPKAKPLTVPCRKKQRCMSSKQDDFQHAMPQDFIEKQKAYFKEIDNFELLVEEIESVDEMD